MIHDPIDHGRVDEARMYTVDANSKSSHFGGDIAGEGFNGQLGRRVVGASGQDPASLYGADVDYGAGAAGVDCTAAKHLATEPFSAQINVDNVAPLLIGEIEERDDGLDAGVVDQHVDRPKFFLYAIEHGLDLISLAYICFDHEGAAALAPNPGCHGAGLLAGSEMIDS